MRGLRVLKGTYWVLAALMAALGGYVVAQGVQEQLMSAVFGGFILLVLGAGGSVYQALTIGSPSAQFLPAEPQALVSPAEELPSDR